jgi:hypothetical protein
MGECHAATAAAKQRVIPWKQPAFYGITRRLKPFAGPSFNQKSLMQIC